MNDTVLDTIRDWIQVDIGHRGLRTDPAANLITACANDFHAACRSVAETSTPSLLVLTGFFIPDAQPPGAETDGPLGAIFLARALSSAGIEVVLVTDPFCQHALEVGLEACGLPKKVMLVTDFGQPPPPHEPAFKGNGQPRPPQAPAPLTHLIALERVGPSHTLDSIRAQPGATPALVEQFLRDVPSEHQDRCHTMRGRDITEQMAPAHVLVEVLSQATPPVATIGIGDGGNEIGMGKIPWEIIRRNIPNGGLVACRVPTDQLIVSGISNWGAYGLAAGVLLLRGHALDPDLFHWKHEQEILRLMVKRGPLVDGVTGQQTVTVDGLSFKRYAEPLRRLRELVS
jgi:hypothetical protein